MRFKEGRKSIKNPESSGTGFFYILLIIGFVIFAGTILSGGSIPINPNSPGGPPTLPPYFNIDGTQDKQRIILPSEALTPNPKGNLQLKTFKVNACGRKSAIDILIDTSGSMADDDKLDKLKHALEEFTKNLSKKSAISIQTFSAYVENIIPWDFYENNKTQIQEEIDDLYAEGHTVMRDGFEVARDNLNEAITHDMFPGYNYALLLISDGVPEIPPPHPDTRDCLIRVEDPRTWPDLRCFAIAQDPRTPTSLPQEIKAMGVPIYVIGLYSNTTSDQLLQEYLEPLLKNDIATSPSSPYYYYYNSEDSEENLKKIFDDIVNKICEDEV